MVGGMVARREVTRRVEFFLFEFIYIFFSVIFSNSFMKVSILKEVKREERREGGGGRRLF